MTPLAKSQFFFLRNVSISSVARSCGSRFCVESITTSSASSSKGGFFRSRNPSLLKQTNDRILGEGQENPLVGGAAHRVVKTNTNSINASGQTRQYSTLLRILPKYHKYSPLTGRVGPFSLNSFSTSRQMNADVAATPASTTTTTTTITTSDFDKKQKKILSQILQDSQSSNVNASETTSTKSKRAPANSSKLVGYWLVGSAGLVFGIVVLGGLTRLTESGLSITEWKPVTGSIPPLTKADWEAEFALYKNSPEFKILNSNITLEEFKFIYYMEWSHRLWGRTIGLVFVLPAAYFVFTRKTSPHTTKRLLLISGLLALQGFIGWWMVKSGLDDDLLNQPGAHPRVSQYRLATHLGAAFLLYIAMINTGLDVLREARWVRNPQAALKEIAALSNPIVTPFRRSVIGLACLAFVTSMSGAFVAGLDAGLIYNSFPFMGEGYSISPSRREMFDPQYAADPSSGFNVFWKNMLENPATVQFNHRVLAVTTFTATLAMHLYSHRFKSFVPRSIIRTGAAAVGFVTLQATLGICTLLWVVPTPLAASHQAGSLAFLTAVLVLAARLRLPPSRIRRLITLLSQSAQNTVKKTNRF